MILAETGGDPYLEDHSVYCKPFKTSIFGRGPNQSFLGDLLTRGSEVGDY